MSEQKPGKIFAKIAAIAAEIKGIEKTRRNQQQGNLYRSIDDFYCELQPLFAKHGVFVLPEVLEIEKWDLEGSSRKLPVHNVKMRFTLVAEDGSLVTGTMLGSGMDTGDKGIPKAESMALKYFLQQLFLVPTEETPDADRETPGAPKAEAAEAPKASGKRQTKPPANQPEPKAKDGGKKGDWDGAGGDKKGELLEELQALVSRDKIDTGWILGRLKKFKRIEASCKSISDMPEDAIQNVINTWQYFVEKHAEEKKK